MSAPDLLRAVVDSPFFSTMAADEQVALARLGTLHEHGDGEALFRPREAPSALYLVVDGIAEISRRESPDGELEPVAYAGSGATLAASKVITGSPFEALARFPEGGHTVQWSRTDILRRLYRSQAFSIQYLQNLARRLEGTFAALGSQGATKLRGRLDHFDLPTILQTVVDAGASGVLEVADATGARYGDIYASDRTIGPMRCGALVGPEAFFEILVTPPARGTFSFSSGRAAPATGHRFELPPLLFEAARLQDELRRFRAELPADLPLRLTGHPPAAAGGRAGELVDRIRLALAGGPMAWEELAGRLPYSRCRVALAVRDLLLDGSVAVLGSSRRIGSSG